MGRMHEALQRAEEEFQKSYMENRREFRKMPQEAPQKRISAKNEIECYDILKTNLLTRYSNGAVKSILFNGLYHDGGCTTTLVNLAIALTRDSQLKVLLVDVNLRTPGLQDMFKIDETLGLTDLPDESHAMESLLKRVGPGELYVLTCGNSSSVPLALFESSRFDAFLKSMRERFDFILLDAPPVLKFSECRVLCKKVDGVVMILESGKVRYQVANRAKKDIAEAGGKLLGVVLNKRKHYIPDWIYNRL